MLKHYRTYYNVDDDDDESDLPFGEYFRFVKLWDIVVILSDIFTLLGTVEIIYNVQASKIVLMC